MAKIKRTGIILCVIVLQLFNLLLIDLYDKKTNLQAYQLLNWNLVDSGKHLDWGGSTKYASSWDISVQKWNEVHNIIRRDTWRYIKDVEISDYYENDGIMGFCASNGKIKFNDYYFAEMTAGERQKTVMHEIGHALGLDDNNTVEKSVMRQGRRSQTELYRDDKDGFDWLYKYKY